jgi:tetratricopeptide (TPR) repeat protein
MFTDMVGYTTLGQRDESLLLALVEEQRKVVRPILKKHHGREVQTIGDAFLVEFASTLDAVKCAYDIQVALHDLNSGRRKERVIKVRIGIHVGDVVHKENEVYGDVVNLASRVETSAESEGIAISGQVHDNIRNKVDFPFEYVGEQSLKNVDVPLEIYRIILPWDEGTGGAPTVLEREIVSKTVRRSEAEERAVFVDRDAERAMLSSALDEVAATGRSKVIFLGGEAGIGKTALLDWVVHEATSRFDAFVGRGFCLEDVSVPYFSFSEALSVFLHGKSADEGTRRVMNWLDRALRRMFAEADAEFDRYQLYENIVTLLDTISREKVVLIALEDLHWADSASLGLLHYLARNIKSSRVLVVCTFRTEELAEVAPGRPHQLYETMMLMGREGLVQRMELSGLPAKVLAELTGSIIPGAPIFVLQKVAKESEGSPLYAIESTRFLIETGAVEKVAGSWRTRNFGGLSEIPGAILDVIARRLSRLSQEDKNLIECASVIGEHFDPKILSRALGIDELTSVQKLARLGRETKLVVEVETGYRFDHAKVREAVYKGLTTSLSRELHRRVAEELSKKPDSHSATEIANHYHLSGDKARTIEFAMLAGDQAKSLSSFAEAVSSYTLAVDETEGDEASAETRAKALVGRAVSLDYQSLFQKAIEDCKLALSLSMEPSTRLPALRYCADSYLGLGHFTEALEVVERAKGEPGEEKLHRLHLRAIEATIISRRMGYSSTVGIFRELSQEYLEMGLKKDYANSVLAALDHEMAGGPPPNFFEVVHKASEIFDELKDPLGEAKVSGLIALYYFIKGEAALGSENYARAVKVEKKLGSYGGIMWDTLYWGMLFENAGMYEDAIRVSLEGLDAAAMAEAPYPETGLHATLVRCYLRTGRVDDSRLALGRMNELYEKHSKDASVGLHGLVERSRALTLEFEGRVKDADLGYARAIDLLIRFGLLTHESEARREYGGLLVKQKRWEEAKGQLEETIRLYEKVGNASGVKFSRKVLEAQANESV